MINLEENFNELINTTKLEDDSSKLCDFLKKEINMKFKKYFNYIRLYYEKALEINPDDEAIWNLYIEITKELNKNGELSLSILSRATKCCYFNIFFWILKLREMEKLGKSFLDIQNQIQLAYTSADDEKFLSEIWKYCLEFYCRNFDASVEQLSVIRASFDSALTDIETKGVKEYFPKILSIWAEFETYKVRDATKVAELMNRIVKLDSTPENWKTFINYEKFFGNVESIRKVFKRAVEYSKDEKDYFSENWILWEKM